MYTLQFHPKTRSLIVKRILFIVLCTGISLAQQATSTEQQKLTIRSIYEPHGIPDRMPQAIKWSPDGNKVSYFLADEKEDRVQLYYIDVATGKQAVLVASEKLRSMTPPPAKNKDDRDKDNRARYNIYELAGDAITLVTRVHDEATDAFKETRREKLG